MIIHDAVSGSLLPGAEFITSPGSPAGSRVASGRPGVEDGSKNTIYDSFIPSGYNWRRGQNTSWRRNDYR